MQKNLWGVFIFNLTMCEKTYKMRSLSDKESAKFWGHSSVGRAPALQAGGRQFESDWLHQNNKGRGRKSLLGFNKGNKR